MFFLFLLEILIFEICDSGHEKTRWLLLPAGFGAS
jgi:hypothetical protein